jgi:hypothetical protein
MDLTTRELLKDHDRAAHKDHLCQLVEERQMRRVATLARDAEFICGICGRVAKSSENLCQPTKLEQ